jgi:hypothetical protein
MHYYTVRRSIHRNFTMRRREEAPGPPTMPVLLTYSMMA